MIWNVNFMFLEASILSLTVCAPFLISLCASIFLVLPVSQRDRRRFRGRRRTVSVVSFVKVLEMAAGDEKVDDFYKVMGLKKECSSEELKTAYKKLAMKWHPDRCYATCSDLEYMEKAKNKFQSIQQAYSVLSDTNKRFLYDVGVYDNNDDDDENGMGDFLGEMADMMRQTEPTEAGSFEDLQELFNDMFQDDTNGSSTCYGGYSNFFSTPFTYSNSSQNLKRDNADMTSGRRETATTASSATHSAFSHQFSSPEQTFCFGMSNSGSSSSKATGGGGGDRRRNGRKQKVSSRHDVSSRDSGISAS